MEFDIKEYNSVVLGALLHDVGKFLHRGDNKYKYSNGHEAASAKFINKFLKMLKELNLPVRCILMSTGGKFIILAPTIDCVKDKLIVIYRDICDWLLEEFSGELSLVMVWGSTRLRDKGG